MVRFYSNENLDVDLVESIRKLGYDVLTSYEANQANRGISDSAVLKYATSNNRCVITFDRSDFLLLHQSAVEHCGIIVCREMKSYLSQAQELHDYLEQSQIDLKNRFLRLLKRNQPGSSEQVFVVQEYPR